MVHKVEFNDCNSIYIGKRKCALKTRLREHKANYKLPNEKHSVITKHVNLFNYNFHWTNISVLDVEANYYPRPISEIIDIEINNSNTLNV